MNKRNIVYWTHESFDCTDNVILLYTTTLSNNTTTLAIWWRHSTRAPVHMRGSKQWQTLAKDGIVERGNRMEEKKYFELALLLRTGVIKQTTWFTKLSIGNLIDPDWLIDLYHDWINIKLTYSIKIWSQILTHRDTMYEIVLIYIKIDQINIKSDWKYLQSQRNVTFLYELTFWSFNQILWSFKQLFWSFN